VIEYRETSARFVKSSELRRGAAKSAKELREPSADPSHYGGRADSGVG
jgi:hypothetical protein